MADTFGFAHLDRGLLYRAVGAPVLAGQEAVAPAQVLAARNLDEAALRTAAVAQASSMEGWQGRMTRSLSRRADSSRVEALPDRKSTRLNSSHTVSSYAVFCLKKKNISMIR